MELAYNLFLTDIMHTVSNALMAPVIVILLALVGYALWCIGSLVMEALSERRNYRAKMPLFLNALAASEPDGVPGCILESGLLNRQKSALLALWDFRCMPHDAYRALARRLIASEDARYSRIVARNDTATKVAPMFGLMGTLIPLGPGIVALGQGDTTTLSHSLGVAFDTTVCGLITAAVCFAVSRVRKAWYENYMVSLETAMQTLIEVVEDLRDAGAVDITEPGTSLVDAGFRTRAEHMGVVERSLAETRGTAKQDGDKAVPDEAEEAIEDVG